MVGSRFAVVVSLEVFDATRDQFLALVKDNAATSIEERGCRRFDIVETANLIVLYELYDDNDAFAAHLGTAHFQIFDAATKAMIRAKSVVSGPVFELAKPR